MIKTITCLPLLATILTAVVAVTTTTTPLAYGQDVLFGDPDIPVLNSTERQKLIDQRVEQERQEYLRQKELQASAPTPTPQQQPTPAATPEGFTQFSNAFFGLTVSYPATWEVRDPYTGAITGETSILQIFAPGDGPMDASRPNLNFEIAPEYIPGMLIKDVQDRYMTRVYGGMPNVQILDSSVITLPGNIQAYMLEYSFDSLEGDNLTHAKIMTSPPQLEKTYEITFSTPTEEYAELKPVFQQILSTVQFG